jgi:isoleucyl-tRNA synthetase
MFQKPNPRQSFPDLELEMLEYWRANNTFKKSLAKNEGKEEYVFYDGPPFATGLPHYGHILAGTLKDVVPRYQTMRGKYVPRRWGWDCHGLPVENLVEKELGLKDKQAIIELGVDKFNEACRSSVLRYTKEWGKVVERMGRWVDFENSYKTMSPDFMESIWWVFKTLWDKGLVYKGKKSMHVCPRCVTPLSNFEVGLGYKDVTDFSSTSQFKLNETKEKKKVFGDKPTYVLAWTTTTWTLPGNLLLAVGEEIDYSIVHQDGKQYVIAKFCLPGYQDQFAEVVEDVDSLKEIPGKDLVGLSYEPLFDVFQGSDLENIEKGWHIVAADFVTTDSGTGVVHIASGYGEDDMNLAKSLGLPVLQHVNMDGSFIKELGPAFAQLSTVGYDPKKKADEAIAQMLKDKDYFFAKHSYRHSYPHCWRCDNPLINYATDSWYVSVEKIKEKMTKNNQKINWVPDHLRDGRFGKWLEGARDWAISRTRYWGAPLPVWEAVSDGDSSVPLGRGTRSGSDGGGPSKKTTECIGSIADLRARMPGRFTKITLVRHGQSEGNVIGLRQSVAPGTGLTKLGKKQAKEAGKRCAEIQKKEAFDRVIASPLRRTQETAQGILEGMEVDLKIETDEQVREINFGESEGKRDIEMKDYMKERSQLGPEDHYKAKCGKTGESHEEVTKRALEFIQKMIKEHPGESILVVTHSDILRLSLRELNGDSLEMLYANGHYPMGQPKELYFDNETGKLVDLHKHFVDDMEYKHLETGETMKRIPEVLDCWFESGSMPYAQAHYPFENKERFEATFPANFIAEGLDQTRGWFYTLTVLASALFDEPAFQNVIVNGIVLAEDGQKMSKSKQNYPDPNIVFDKYGADAMRIYLMHSPVVKADDMRFAEKGVQEVVRQTMLPLWNAYSFLLTYAEIDGWKPKGQIYLVRHGETAINKEDKAQGSMDEPLNDHGRDQVEALRNTTKDLPVEVIVSSDYIRAKQTADILNADFELEIDVWEDLREQSFGEWEGVEFEEIKKSLPGKSHPYHEFRVKPPKGETLETFEKRVTKALEDIKAKYPGKNVMVVAHGGVYHVMKKLDMGVSWEEYYSQQNFIKNAELRLFESEEHQPSNKLDRWILSELNTLIQGMTEGLDEYDLTKGLDPLVRFIDSLTNWYIRRSRRRFWKTENDGDKGQAYQTLYIVLVEICKLLAPFAPFITEAMYRNLTGLESVHLAEWPEVQSSRIDAGLNQEIDVARQIVTLGHAARSQANIKVRQPLATLEVALPPSEGTDTMNLEEQLDVIKEELNVKNIVFLESVEGKVKVIVKPNGKLLGPKLGAAVQDVIREAKAGNYTQLDNGNYLVNIARGKAETDVPLKGGRGASATEGVELTPEEIEIAYQTLDEGEGHHAVEADAGIVVILDTAVTPELEREGFARDMIRAIQNLRKEADLNVADRIKVGLTTDAKDVQKAISEYQDYIKAETLAVEILADKLSSDWESVLNLGDHGVVVTIEKA